MEAGRRAQQLTDLAGLQTACGFGVKTWQTIERAPAEIAALQCIRRIGEGSGQLGEILAGLRPLEGLLAAQTKLLQLLGTGRLRRAHQDVRELVFLAATTGCRLVGQVVVNFAIGNDQFAVDLALAQANCHDLVANFLTELGVLHAILFQRGAKLRQGHLVAGSDAANGLLKLAVVDPHA